MKKRMRIGRQLCACLLAVILLITTFTVPAEYPKAAGKVTAAVTKLWGNSDWAEFSYSVTNGTDKPISGVQIKVPYSGTISNFQFWNCSLTQMDGYILITHTAVIEAGATYTCDANSKFGFSGGATFGTPSIEYTAGKEGGGTSSSELKYKLTGKTKDVAFADTPVGQHGKLSLATVKGYTAPVIVDKQGNPYQLRGASTHGMHWNEMHPYVNKGSFQSLRDEWGINMVRLVSYVTQGGYTQGSQELLDKKIQEGVKYATELGMYVIIDWHVHAENPWNTKTQAEEFFKKYATMYKDYENVIFEVCNEPTGVSWYNNGSGGDLYTYCKDMATIIRNCGSDALIVCGTNTWSQDVDEVVKKPLKDDGFQNILYTFHFYSATHYGNLMQKVQTALADGTPIFVTEFGICDASGNGNFDTANADAWIKLCDDNNLSFCCWSLCNKNESASYLKPECTKTEGGWVESDLATTGIWLFNTCRAHAEAEKSNAQSMKITANVKNIRNISVKKTYKLAPKQTLKLKVKITSKDAKGDTLTFTSSRPKIAKIDGNGQIVAGKKAGKTTITITSSGGLKQSFKVQVMKRAVKRIKIKNSSKTLKLKKGNKYKLDTKIYPGRKYASTRLYWKSANKKIATVTQAGVVKGVKKGKTRITAYATDGSGKKATIAVRIK